MVVQPRTLGRGTVVDQPVDFSRAAPACSCRLPMPWCRRTAAACASAGCRTLGGVRRKALGRESGARASRSSGESRVESKGILTFNSPEDNSPCRLPELLLLHSPSCSRRWPARRFQRKCAWPTNPTAPRFARGSCCSPTRSSSARRADVADCAALVRHAFREALRAHTPEWVRRSALPFAPQFADVRSAPRAGPGGWPLFRVSDGADAAVRRVCRRQDADRLQHAAARPRHAGAARRATCSTSVSPDRSEPDHLMVFVGRSHFEGDGDDWVVYHTGPIAGWAGRSAQGAARDPCATSGAAMAAARLESAASSASSDWQML